MAYTLTAEKRADVKKHLSALRGNNLIPAVLYGFKVENVPLQVNSKDFKKIYEQAGENQIVDLEVGGKQSSVLIREVQIHPVKRDIIHADFQAVDVSQPVIVAVPIHFEGEAPAIKATGGSLVKKLQSIEIKCLPKDLPKRINVSLASLETLEDAIHVTDLKLADGLEILTESSEMIATVVPPRVEKEPEAEAAEGVEGEAPAEGEAEAAPEAGEEKKDDEAEKDDE